MKELTWIKHDGGSCPVSFYALVRVKLRGDNEFKTARFAGAYRWPHHNDGSDIIEYAVVERPAVEATAAEEEVLSQPQPKPEPKKAVLGFGQVYIAQSFPEIDPSALDAAIDATPAADALLDAAAKHMRDRAVTYDQPGGERSMGRAVEAFNTITGHGINESEGWLFMALLKMVRSESREAPHRDSIEDLVAYCGLYGEARLGGK